MAGTDINTVAENAIRRYFSKIGINSDLFNIDSLENSIAGIVYDPSEELERKKDLLFEKIKGAIQDKEYKTALVHMNEGIDSKIMSCDDYESDWSKFIDSFYDHYWSHAEAFIRDFIGRIEKKEISTKIPLSECYEMLASSMACIDVAGKRKYEAMAAIDKAIELEKSPERIEQLTYLKNIYSRF